MAYLGKSIEKEMHFGAKPELFNYALEMRKNPTETEQVLWRFTNDQVLRNKELMISQIYKYITESASPALPPCFAEAATRRRRERGTGGGEAF